MRKLILLACLVLPGIFWGCKKDSYEDCDEFWITTMNNKWGAKIKCEDAPHQLYTALFKGSYNGEVIYYVYTTGPGVISASLAPLKYVVNCRRDSIEVNNDTKIEKVSILATSCE